MEARPYAHIICQKFAEERCNFCLKSFGNLKKCGACKSVRYCEMACQKGDWKIHKTECPIMKRVPNVPTDSIRLYLRLVLLHLVHASKVRDSKAEAPCIRSFSDLMSHSENIKTDKKRAELFHVATDFLRAYTHGILQLPNDDILLDIFGKMVINTFTIADEMLQDVGVAVYNSPSILDHKCWPNAVASFDGHKVVVRAVEDISSDSLSDVYINYVDPMATISERCQQLQEQYYFNCCCNACQDKEMEARMVSTEGSNEGDVEKVKECLQAINEKQKEPVTDEAGDLLTQCEDCLTQIRLPAYNVYLARLRGKAFDLAIEAEQWERALEHGVLNLKPYSALNPPYTPTVGYLYANLGKLLMYLGKLYEAVLHLNKAEEKFAVSLGKSHSLYGQVREMLAQCEAELAHNEASAS